MTLNGHFVLNSVLCHYVWSSEAWRSKLGGVSPPFQRAANLKGPQFSAISSSDNLTVRDMVRVRVSVGG